MRRKANGGKAKTRVKKTKGGRKGGKKAAPVYYAPPVPPPPPPIVKEFIKTGPHDEKIYYVAQGELEYYDKDLEDCSKKA